MGLWLIIGIFGLGLLRHLWVYLVQLRSLHKELAQAYSKFEMHGIRTSPLVEDVITVTGFIDWSWTAVGVWKKLGIEKRDGSQIITTNFLGVPITPEGKSALSDMEDRFLDYKNETRTFTLAKLAGSKLAVWETPYALLRVD